LEKRGDFANSASGPKNVQVRGSILDRGASGNDFLIEKKSVAVWKKVTCGSIENREASKLISCREEINCGREKSYTRLDF